MYETKNKDRRTINNNFPRADLNNVNSAGIAIASLQSRVVGSLRSVVRATSRLEYADGVIVALGDFTTV